jgi:Trk K+ transport system NAD-binding subunit
VNLEWGEVEVKPQSPLVGVKIVEAGIRRRFGVAVVGVRREKMLGITPELEVHDGDVLIVLGSPDRIRAFAQEAGGELGESQI